MCAISPKPKWIPTVPNCLEQSLLSRSDSVTKKKNNSTKTEKFPDLPTKRVECYTARAGALKPEITRGKSEPAPREKKRVKRNKKCAKWFQIRKGRRRKPADKSLHRRGSLPPLWVWLIIIIILKSGRKEICVRVLCIDPVFGRAGKVNEIRANIESRNFRALLVCAAFRRREGKATKEENWKKI